MTDFYSIIEKARKSGKIDIGTNEVTKAVERGVAKLAVIANDVEPKEIVQHIPILCKEKNIPCVNVDSKEKLGVAAGINVKASAIAVLEAGDADKDIAAIKPEKT